MRQFGQKATPSATTEVKDSAISLPPGVIL
jgi:hypothetical protein